MIAELLVKLTWSQDQNLKEERRENLIKIEIAKNVLNSFEKYDFWLMRYRDVVQEPYEVVEYEEFEEDMDSRFAGGGYF